MTVATPPREALDLHEAIESKPSALSADGTVTLHVIRPTVGLGRGNHLYEATMLQENAAIFGGNPGEADGWKMYVDHLSPQARKAAGGLPRSVRDLAGRIEESWWDPNVPANGRYGQGAVAARVRPVGIVKKLIEEDPGLLEASISATATGVRPGDVDGKRVWIVEGIEPQGSVDFVTEGGAGGKIAQLVEAMTQDDYGINHEEDEMDPTKALASLSDDELQTYLRENRSDLVTKLSESNPKSDPEPEPKPDPDPAPAGDTTSPADVKKMVQEALVQERELIRAEARADSDRQIELRDLRDEARRLIAESKLPQSWQAKLCESFDIVDGKPTDKLDQVDDVDDSGEVTRKAAEFLREAVEADIEEQRKLLAEARPTRVSGQGPAEPADAGEPTDPTDKPYFEEFLEEAGIDPVAAYTR